MQGLLGLFGGRASSAKGGKRGGSDSPGPLAPGPKHSASGVAASSSTLAASTSASGSSEGGGNIGMERAAPKIRAREEESLDLCYITPRILMVGRPTAREGDRADHRNNLGDLVKFLDRVHSGDYLVFNLSNKNRNTIDYGRFRNQIVEFQPYSPMGVIDDAPAFGQIFRVLYTLRFWLEWSPETIAVLHCNNGVFRTGFILACYLVYSGVHRTMREALAMISEKRLGDASLAEKFYPSWRYLVKHLDSHFAMPPGIPKVLKLSYIILAAPGLVRPGDQRFPIIQIYQGPKMFFDTSTDCIHDDTVRWEGDKLIVEVEGRYLCGDYQLWVLAPHGASHQVSFEAAATPLPDGTGTPDAAAALHGSASRGSNDAADSSAARFSVAAAAGAGMPAARSSLSINSKIAQAQALRELRAEQAGRTRHGGIGGRGLAARAILHSSILEPGVVTLGQEDVDIFRPAINKAEFSLSLVLDEVPHEIVNDSNLTCVLKRSFINIRGDKALCQGAVELSAHHYAFPDAALRKQLVNEGYDDVAVVCSLQRANNEVGRAREFLDSAVIRRLFRERQAERDLKLLRETLTPDEIAGVLAARANVVIKKKGLNLGDLDFSGLLEAAKLGTLHEGPGEGGAGGPGTGAGGGAGGSGSGGKKGRKRKHKLDARGRLISMSDDDDSSDGGGRGGKDSQDEEEEDEDGLLAGAAGGRGAAAGKLFDGEPDAKDDANEEGEGEEEEEEVDEGGEEEWKMAEHPIFGRFFKLLADGKAKGEVEKEMEKDKFNPALLGCDPNGFVPDGIAASTAPIKEWEFIQKYFKMLKIGLPRSAVEHKMVSEFVSAAILNMDAGATVSAKELTPMKKRKAKGPQILRKKLHWVPIKGKVEGTIWAGPPGDLIGAAKLLITNEKEFERLFIQKPEDLKKKKKRADDGGIIQLVDQKRAMTAGIALAKLKIPFAIVVECLNGMACRSSDGAHLLSLVELQNLRNLCPTDDEVLLVKGFKGDVKRLGQCEKFFMAVADVPNAKSRAEGLYYQANFDERVTAAGARIKLFASAVDQIKGATRFQRMLKAILVLGNKLNGVTKKERRKTVKAFTVNSLHQLHLTKAFDQQTSVLQYFIHLLKRRDPDLLRLSKDFKGPTLAEAKRLPLDIMNEEMKELREGLTSLESLVREAVQAEGWRNLASSQTSGEQFVYEDIETDEKHAPRDTTAAGSAEATGVEAADAAGAAGGAAGAHGEDATQAAAADGATSTPEQDKSSSSKKRKRIRRRVEPLPDFAAAAQTALGNLQSSFDDAQAGYKGLVKFFKEDGDMAADELFGTIHMFLQTFDATLKAMLDKKRKEREARRRKAEAERVRVRTARRKEAIERGEEPPPDTPTNRGGAGAGEGDEDSDSDAASGDGSDTGTGGGAAGKRGRSSRKDGAEGAWTEAVAESEGEEEAEEAEEEPDEENGHHPTAAAAGGASAAAPAAAPAAAAAGDSSGRPAFLSGILGRRKGGSDDGAAEANPASGGGGAGGAKAKKEESAGDPRGGLLAAIRKKQAPTTPIGEASPAAAPAAGTGSAAEGRGAPAGGLPSSEQVPPSGGGVAAAAGGVAPDVGGGGQGSTAAAGKEALESSSSQDPRSVMLAAIARRKKE